MIKLFLILLLALLLRLPNLNQSLWLDEAIQALAVSQNSLKDLFVNYFPNDFNPPLSYLVTSIAVKIFGLSEIALRLPSVIFGVLNVWLIYHFSRRLLLSITKNSSLSSQFSVLSSSLLATAPLHIYYSQEARPYILACLLATWSMYEFLTPGVDKTPRGVNLNWRYILSTTLMLYSHYMTWLLIPTQLLIFCLVRVRLLRLRSDPFKYFPTSWLAIFLLLTPWLPTFLKQLWNGRGVTQALPIWSSLGTFSFKNLSLIPAKFLIGRISIENNIIYGLILLPILLLVAYLLIKTIKQATSKKLLITYYLLLITFLWLFLPITLAIFLSLKLPILQYFRFLFVLPAFYMLLAYGISTGSFLCAPDDSSGCRSRRQAKVRPYSRQGSDPIKKGLIIFFLTLNLISSATYLLNPKFHHENWKGTVNFISQKNLNIPVVILEPISAPFKFYTSEVELIDYQEVEKVKYLPQIWLIKYSQPIFDPQNLTEKKLKNFGFEEISEHHFRGIIVKYLVNPSGLKA
jgi:uncharacterized membrane protein